MLDAGYLIQDSGLELDHVLVLACLNLPSTGGLARQLLGGVATCPPKPKGRRRKPGWVAPNIALDLLKRKHPA